MKAVFLKISDESDLLQIWEERPVKFCKDLKTDFTSLALSLGNIIDSDRLINLYSDQIASNQLF